MTTNDMFRKIYTELKEEFMKNSSTKFLKEYRIPSINFNPTDTTLSDHYFSSGINMEIERILEFFNYEIYHYSYQDKHFFSNDEELVKQKWISEIPVKDDLENNFEM